MRPLPRSHALPSSSSFQVRAGLARYTITGTPLHEGKSAATVMFWDPGPDELSVTAEDRAGNGCQANLFLMYGNPLSRDRRLSRGVSCLPVRSGCPARRPRPA